ncbi:hypothetical protein B0H63DRAFT_535301 [Podospora didyma]|uniref:NAD(P)-binding protein n=1 Tax=Podospora didyma TaxID=330526 RepID=A0AAE0K2D4_9PEZI|nr:hypothetical protein B0H63DRAFT_535301 [Podospora didyma]
MADLAALPKDWIVTPGQFTRATYSTVYPAIDPTKPKNYLTGKTVVVTGASRGIGARGIAPAFVKAGVKAIVLVATNAANLASVEKKLHNISPAIETLLLSVDISSVDQVAKAWVEINARYDRVDILVNNAGEVNVKGTHSMTQQFLKAAMSWATTTNLAKVINMTSSSAWGVWPFLAAYANSKAAMVSYTTTLAASYPGTVFAVAVNPGLNDTDILPSSPRYAGFNCNDPSLTGGTLVWLAADVDVEELVARKQEITSKNLLTMQLNARLGAKQFAA